MIFLSYNMSRETVVNFPTVKDMVNARLLELIRHEKEPLNAGADAINDLFHGLAKQMPSITGRNFDGLVFYESRAMELLGCKSTCNSHNGDIQVISADSEKPLSGKIVNKGIIASAAPLTGRILLALVNSVGEYEDPGEVARAVSAFKKLKDAHLLARRIAAAALRIDEGNQLRTETEEIAWGQEGAKRTSQIEAALLWHQERRATTAAITSATKLSSDTGDMSFIQEALATLAQGLTGDDLFRDHSDFLTKDGDDWVIVEKDSKGDLMVSTSGRMARKKNTKRKVEPLSNAEFLAKAGPAAGKLISRCIESVLPNLNQNILQPKQSEA